LSGAASCYVGDLLHGTTLRCETRVKLLPTTGDRKPPYTLTTILVIKLKNERGKLDSDSLPRTP